MYLSTATTEFKAGEEAHARKITKYDSVATEHGYQFIPLVFESTGRPSKDAKKMFNTLFQNYRETYQIRHSAITNMRAYWMCKISATLQRCIADSIVLRSRYANSNYKETTNPEQLSMQDEYEINYSISE